MKAGAGRTGERGGTQEVPETERHYETQGTTGRKEKSAGRGT